MPLFRCYRCNPPIGHEFESRGAVCDKCKATPPAVQRLVYVHWLVPDAENGTIAGSQGKFRPVCEPTRTNLIGYQATNAPVAVSCPKCKRSPDFTAALDRYLEENA